MQVLHIKAKLESRKLAQDFSSSREEYECFPLQNTKGRNESTMKNRTNNVWTRDPFLSI
jgi:hypothetical protein